MPTKPSRSERQESLMTAVTTIVCSGDDIIVVTKETKGQNPESPGSE